VLVLVSNAAVAFFLNVAAVFLVGVASSLVLTLSGVFKVRLDFFSLFVRMIFSTWILTCLLLSCTVLSISCHLQYGDTLEIDHAILPCFCSYQLVTSTFFFVNDICIYILIRLHPFSFGLGLLCYREYIRYYSAFRNSRLVTLW
jgi:hypothetical protein